MLNRFTVKQRMYIIIALILALFLGMAWAAVNSSNKVRDMAISSTEKVMLEDQKDKIRVATHSVALSAGHAIEDVSGAEARVRIIRNLIDDIRFEEDESGYYFVYRDTTNVALPPNKDLQGKDLGDLSDKNGVQLVEELKKEAHDGGGFVQYIWPKPGAGDVPKLSYAEMIPGTDYWIGTGVYLDNIDAYKSEMKTSIDKRVTGMITRLLTVAGIFFAGIVVLCLVIVFGISRSLKSMITNFRDIAEGEGDLTKRIDIKSKDELGELAGWFNVFMEKLQDIIRRMAEESTNVDRSSKELTGISEQMSRGAVTMSDKTKTVATAAEEMSSSLTGVAASMEQSSSNSNMVASAAEEMNSTINEIASNAEKARGISEQAARKTSDASEQMKELRQAADSVGKVVETISDISEQVNLLALNATIEAARAGEAGKGFAVVANEIKALAGQTSDATQDIQGQIENIQNVSGRSADVISEVTSSMNSTQEIVSSIASAIEEQSSATGEISTNVEQLSAGIQEVNENVAQSSQVADSISEDIADVSSESSDISKNSSQVKDRAEQLKQMSEKLKEIVHGFVIEKS
ncbi:MAG: methyl-accepting chemotaxis protein [Desulfarculaceae bacterium]|nr:methyl-accepting chemotaxis protein [Desulfarculaceae bacterium]